MKSATVTWITYNNYGTMLQAYALQSYLRENHGENVIISDKYIVSSPCNNVEADEFEPHNNIINENQHTTKSRIRMYLFHPFKLLKNIGLRLGDSIEVRKQKKYTYYYDSQNEFDNFRKRELHITAPYTREEMIRLNDEFDVFVCGSDQIWSVLDVNFDGYFYLDFVRKKKIAYAPSFGTNSISSEKMEKISFWLKDFSSISVRESQNAIQLKNELKLNVHCVCDPTLLYNKEYWEQKVCKLKVPKKYMVCYFLENKSWYFEYAKQLAKHLKLKMVLIPSRWKFCENKSVYNGAVGPKEFISLIAYSSFVLTDSYHGSIFAMLYEKQFLHLKRFTNDDNSQNIRVNHLFNKVNLLSCVVTEKSFAKTDLYRIDYESVSDILEKFRSESRAFIENALVKDNDM